ncbi:MAG: polysaccharide biosynthesis tyrosine autokinase [bacterium]|nr:polysaccharide biosynthesis tyrosine autokinase [bacterium]
MSSEGRSPESEPGLSDYLNVLLRRWWLIAAAVGLAVAAAVAGTLITPPVYRATATIVVDRGGSALGLIPDFTGMSQQAYVDTLAEIMKSRSVGERALARLGTSKDNLEKELKKLQDGLKVQRVRGADLIRVQAEAPTAQDAAAATNAVAESFLAWHVESRRTQASAGRKFIEGQLVGLTKELSAAENALAVYKTEAGQVALSEQTRIAVNKLAEFEAQRRVAGAERQAAEAGLRQARASLGKLEATIPSAFVTAEDPVSAGLRSELVKLETELAGLREQFTDRHPRVAATNARIEEVKALLRQQVARTLSTETAALNPLHREIAGQVIKLEVERQSLQAREAALAVAAGRYAREVQALPPREVALARLTRDLRIAEETYLLLSQKLQEARIAEASIVGDLRVVDPAVPPQAPVRPRPALNMLLALMLGLMLGVGGAFVLESLDVTFKTPDEAGQSLGLPVLATIPWVNHRRRNPGGTEFPMIEQEHRNSPFTEAFRHLRTSLLYLSPDRPLRTVLVTSPGPDEAKSTVAANLAVVFTQMGHRVWLVECDLRRPGLSWAFQPEGTGGLTELLVDGLPADRALHPTKVENLWFVPGGTVPPNPAELLGSRKMRAFLEHGRTAVDAIILDAPPVLPVTDASVLAPAADGVLLLVRLEKTPREAARRARQQLEAVGARVLGLVVTGAPGRRGKGYYGYYSYYQAGGEDAGKGKAAVGGR